MDTSYWGCDPTLATVCTQFGCGGEVGAAGPGTIGPTGWQGCQPTLLPGCGFTQQWGYQCPPQPLSAPPQCPTVQQCPPTWNCGGTEGMVSAPPQCPTVQQCPPTWNCGGGGQEMVGGPELQPLRSFFNCITHQVWCRPTLAWGICIPRPSVNLPCITRPPFCPFPTGFVCFGPGGGGGAEMVGAAAQPMQPIQPMPSLPGCVAPTQAPGCGFVSVPGCLPPTRQPQCLTMPTCPSLLPGTCGPTQPPNQCPTAPTLCCTFPPVCPPRTFPPQCPPPTFPPRCPPPTLPPQCPPRTRWCPTVQPTLCCPPRENSFVPTQCCISQMRICPTDPR